MTMLIKHHGVTVLEMLLALAVGGVLLTIGMQQYKGWTVGSQAMQLNQTVDQLFNAAAQFYNANCVTGGQLDPAVAEGTTIPVSLNTLVQDGYLHSLPGPNPIVNTSNISNAYIVQFNQYSSPRLEAVCSNPPTCTTMKTASIGTIVLWRIQVAVLMQQTQSNQLAQAQGYLTADCLSQPNSQTGSAGMTVQPCASNKTGNYVVFERLPMYPTVKPRVLSPLWPSYPLLQQFNQMYITYPVNYLIDLNGGTQAQYFYCPHAGSAAAEMTGSD
jgi:prepilin-type N-terminal cleavage/methylation domain-containing protein